MEPKEFFEKCSEMKIPPHIAVAVFLKKEGGDWKSSLYNAFTSNYNPLMWTPNAARWGYNKTKGLWDNAWQSGGKNFMKGVRDEAFTPKGMASILGIGGLASIPHHLMGSLLNPPNQQQNQQQAPVIDRGSIANSFKGYHNI